MGVAIGSPFKHMGVGLRIEHKGRVRTASPRDHAREWYDRVRNEFDEEELETLFTAEGEIHPAYATRLGRIARDAAEVFEVFVGDLPGEEAAWRRYVENAENIYREGERIRAEERIVHEVRRATQPHYTSLGGKAELGLDILEGATYMSALWGVGMIPYVGTAASLSLMYAPQQAQMADRLIYDHHVDPAEANLISSFYAAGHAAIERLQIKTLDPKIAPLISLSRRRNLAIYNHYLGQRFSNYLKRAGNETLEEFWQEDLEFAALAYAQSVADAEGIDLSEEALEGLKSKIRIALTMPGITALGGGAIQSGRAGVKVAQKDIKGAFKELVVPEMQAARADTQLDPNTFEAVVKARSAAQMLEKDQLIPLEDADFYQAHHDADHVLDLNGGEQFSYNTWMEKRGYNPETDHARFEQSVQFIMRCGRCAARKNRRIEPDRRL